MKIRQSRHLIQLVGLLAVIAITIGSLPGCSRTSTDDVSPFTPVGNTGSIDIQKQEKVVTEKIPTAGGVIAIADPGTPLDGMKITVSDGAYEDKVDFTVSYAPVKDHTFGDDFNPISPMIIVDNDDILADIPVEVTIPVTVPEDHFAMAFIYDDEHGTLEGLPVIARDDASITVSTRHFSSMIISSINSALLFADIDSGFRPGVDDWQFANRGSFLQPGGHCSGQSSTAMWYYVTKPDGPDATLFNRYDNNGWEPASPNFWYDDSLGYRFASVVQLEDDFGSKLVNLTHKISLLHEETWSLIAYSMLITGEPQFIGIVQLGT